MKTIMSLEQLTTLTAIRKFLEGTQAVAFGVATNKQERYRWSRKTLTLFNGVPGVGTQDNP